MSKLSKALIAAAGNSGGAGLTVEDVFSTYLYTGNGSTQTITNGIDLDGEGGLVWIKGRNDGSHSHCLYDTERGVTKQLNTNYNSAENTTSSDISRDFSSFNSDGFSLGEPWNTGNLNSSAMTQIASWTFRKAEKFFDIVTYTGDGASSRYINHNLGANAGAIFIKRTDSASDWTVQHRYNNNYNLYLNSTSSQSDSGATNRFNDTEFTVIGSGLADSNKLTNISGATYVAYLFASDAGGFGDDGSESIIKCGSYTGTSSIPYEVDCGFEPQWVMIKNTTSGSANGWYMVDMMRGMTDTGDSYLYANTSDAEVTNTAYKVYPTATGFGVNTNTSVFNGNGSTYIYIAIRRPMKTPESGTEVFESVAYTGNNSTRELNTTILADAVRIGSRSTAGWATGLQSRLTGKEKLFTSSTGGAAGDSWGKINAWDYQDAIEFTSGSSGFQDVNGSSITYIAHAFKRATGFFDVVAYTGTGANPRSVTHNLKVPPELLILKSRQNARTWRVSCPTVTGTTQALILNSTTGVFSSTEFPSLPTETTFTINSDPNINANGENYIAYLFATVAGVSKVGSYTGNGTSQTIDCGFSGGARFFLVKASSTTGDWHVFDTARGIVAGNDSYLELNTTNAEDTDEDAVDPVSSGVIVNETSGANINTSGVTYIYLAIS